MFGETAHHPVSNLNKGLSSPDAVWKDLPAYPPTGSAPLSSPPHRPPHFPTSEGLFAQVTDQPFTQSWNQPTDSQPNSLPPKLPSTDSDSHPTESIYAGDSISSPDSSGWTSESSLFCTGPGWTPNSGPMSKPVRQPAPSNFAGAQHIYAKLQPRIASLEHAKPSIAMSSQARASSPLRLGAPHHSCKSLDRQTSLQLPSSHQITVPSSLLDQSEAKQKLIVLPVTEESSRKYYGFGKGFPEHHGSLSQPFQSDANPNIHYDSYSGSAVSFDNSYGQSLPQPLNVSLKHPEVADHQPLQLRRLNSTSAMLSNIPLHMQTAGNHSSLGLPQAVSTIYSSPGHPIIYPSQSMPFSPSIDRNIEHGPQSIQCKSMYGTSRKSSLPVIKSSPNRNLSELEKLQSGYSKPIQVMDRKQAVYTLRNSLPPASRFSPPVSRSTPVPLKSSGIPTSNVTPSGIPTSNVTPSGIPTYNVTPTAPPRHKHDKTDKSDKIDKSNSGHNYGGLETSPIRNPSLGSYNSESCHIYESIDMKPLESSSSVSNREGNDRSTNFSQNYSETKVKSTSDVPLHLDLSLCEKSNVNDSFESVAINESNKDTINVSQKKKQSKDKKEDSHRQPAESMWPATSVHKDYHVSPQKFSQPIWPPPSTQVPASPGVISKALTFVANSKIAAAKRKKAKMELEAKANNQTTLSEERGIVTSCHTSPKVTVTTSDQPSVARPLIVNTVPKPYGHSSEANKYGKSFVTNLPRIQENIPSKELGSLSSLGSLRSGSITPSVTPTGSQVSLNTSSPRSLPLAWVGDNDRIKQLQIVSKRAKKFENAEVGKPSVKSSLQRFELPRLSQRSKFLQRKQEFEKMEAQSPPTGGESTQVLAVAVDYLSVSNLSFCVKFIIL